MSFGRIHLSILAITAINFAMMLVYSTPRLLGAANGMLFFDLRIMGYSTEFATTYTNTISNEGRLFYLWQQSTLDTFFPALLALSLLLTLYRLAPRLPVLFLSPIAGALFDYYENAAVARILLGASPDEGLVKMASLLTSLKFASVALSLLAIIWLWRKGKPEG